jgi:hypothetical protein
MRRAWTPVLALLIANLLPAQINPKVWNLISPDDKLICGVDLDRYRHSSISPINGNDTQPPYAATSRYLIVIENPSQGQLRILLGFTPHPNPSPDNPALPIMLDATTAIVGDHERIRAGIEQWKREGPPLADAASEARRLAESDDAWLVVLKPLAPVDSAPAGAAPKHLAEVVDVIEEAAAGVRFGAYFQAHLDVRAKTADDAYSLSALGRWLPGLIQAMNPGGKESRLIDLAENLTVQATGRTATLSFSLPEDKLQEVLRQLQSNIVE